MSDQGQEKRAVPLADWLIAPPGEDPNRLQPRRLTRREREILLFLEKDFSNREIAEKLILSLSTVKWYTRQIFEKLEVGSRRQAVARARAMGYLGAATAVEFPIAPITSKHNLPRQLSSFIGREKQINKVCQLIEENRLVTLTGSGGVGKTRLALQVAEALVDQFSDGVWLIELAEVVSPSLVPQAVASPLGLKSLTHQPIGNILSGYLLGKHTLLVLDNCEHLIEACATLAEELLRACPQVKILATSREAFGATGEMVFRVPSLALPDPTQKIDTTLLEEFEAVRLFVERALLSRTDFKVSEQNALAIAQICLSLDGIPLALELAAACLHMLTCEQLSHQLKNTFQVLTFGRRTAMTRHQTLRAAIDWSYRLLSEAEKQMIRRLAVFVGTFDLSAVESICCLEAGEKLNVLDILTSLANKSMLLTERLPGLDMRYRLLETIRQFAHEKLEDSGESQCLRQAYARHYLERACETGREIFSGQAPRLVRRMQADLPNVRVSFSYALEGPETETAVEAMNALWFYWLLSGSAEEGRALMEKALKKLDPEQPSIARASLLRNLGLLSIIQGRSKEALERITLSREMSHILNDRRGYAWACLWMGAITWREYQHFEESARIHKELGDEDSYAFTVWLWGSNSRNYEDLDQAERLLAEAEAFYLKRGSWYISSVYYNQARLYFIQGDIPRARRLYMQSLPIILEMGSQFEEMWWRRWWGEMILAEAADGASLREAEIELMKTIRLAEKFGNRQFFLLSTPVLLADKALQLGDFSIACQNYHRSLIFYQNLLFSGISDWDKADYQNIGQCFLGLAEMAATCSRLTENSVRLLGVVICIGAAVEGGWDDIQSARIQRIAEMTRFGLSSESFQSAWEKGKALSLEQGVNLALEVSDELTVPGEHDSPSREAGS